MCPVSSTIHPVHKYVSEHKNRTIINSADAPVIDDSVNVSKTKDRVIYLREAHTPDNNQQNSDMTENKAQINSSLASRSLLSRSLQQNNNSIKQLTLTQEESNFRTKRVQLQ